MTDTPDQFRSENFRIPHARTGAPAHLTGMTDNVADRTATTRTVATPLAAGDYHMAPYAARHAVVTDAKEHMRIARHPALAIHASPTLRATARPSTSPRHIGNLLAFASIAQANPYLAAHTASIAPAHSNLHHTAAHNEAHSATLPGFDQPGLAFA